MESIHKSVLLKETIDGLNLKDGDLVLDMTFGGGGHSLEILIRYPFTKVIAIDQDSGAWDRAKEKFRGFESRITFVNGNFRNILSALEKMNIKAVDGVILDLGLSSDQLDNLGRGFSFLRDEPLLMTMKEVVDESDITALDVVNTWEEGSLADIIFGYGEEKYATRIAKNIINERKNKKIETTFELVRIIENSVPSFYRKSKIHPATKTFQAIRIAVNDELNALKDGLNSAFEVLNKEKRMAVISFHSLEDRIVKNFFRKKKDLDEVILINKKPLVAGEEELKENKRARSAKLRILQKI